MTYLKSLTLGSLVLLPVTAPAFAADVIRTLPETPAPFVQVEPAHTWAGGYTGIYLGGSANRFKNNSEIGTLRNNNVKVGAYAGWNFQNDNFVYGIEGDAGYNNAKAKKDDLRARSGFDGSLRARLGYDMGVFMPYVTGGIAGTQVRYSNGADSAKKFRVGYTVGAGAETMLTDNVSARLEYRLSDFGKKNVTLGNLDLPGAKLQSHDIRVGVGYRF